MSPGSERLARALGELGRQSPAALVELVAAANDVALLIDDKGVIRDIAAAGSAFDPRPWLGRAWLDTVTTESVAKISEMRIAAAEGRPGRWRQVNHHGEGADVPVRYRLTGLKDGGAIAVGRDLREEARAQQQLIQAQQTLEREYLKLRQAEARYRLLFDLSREPTLIVDAATRRVREANPAAHALIGAKPGALVNQLVSGLVAAGEREAFVAHLARASAHAGPPASFTLKGGAVRTVTATVFRQERAAYLLVRLGEDAAEARTDEALPAIVARMPDAFVVTDASLEIVEANDAFVDLTGAASAVALVGTALADRIGRSGVDLELVAAQLREHGVVRNVGSFVRGSSNSREEIELSGVLVDHGDTRLYGFVLRPVARRLRDLPQPERGAARSVEQLTELVGRISLKDIVRESTDVIERLCIEAALAYTSDNRASAAELLGLSRQSLYSKLHRHGMAVGGEDPVQSD